MGSACCGPSAFAATGGLASTSNSSDGFSGGNSGTGPTSSGSGCIGIRSRPGAGLPPGAPV